MTQGYSVTREIGIDMAHRVPTHGSKCANFHGHRYTVQATCSSRTLHSEGEQKDMTIDFGFLKEIMMQCIDFYCDHGMMLWVDDPWLGHFTLEGGLMKEGVKNSPDRWFFQDTVKDSGGRLQKPKLVVVPFIPTAEKLAEWWYNEMHPKVFAKSNRLAFLQKVTVWETPNCSAEYPYTLPGA